MLQLTNVTLQRGSKILLDKANLMIKPKRKVGLIGKNGCGKSSLFLLMQQKLEAESGDFSFPQEWKVASLQQEITELDKPALEYVIDGDQELRRLEKELALAEKNNDVQQIATLTEHISNIDGFNANSKAHILLHGLGFADDEHFNHLKSFSGGWRVRLNLARTLFCRSDLMLLDEPTNHLDLEAIIWLEKWLAKYDGTIVLISHDRDFLDNVVDHIALIENQSIAAYSGNYSYFEHQHALKLSQQQAAFNKQQKQKEHLMSYVDRFRYKASKAKQAQSRLKALARMEDLQQVHANSAFQFHFRETKEAGGPLLTLDDVALGYDDKEVLTKLRLQISTHERIGLLGPNGAGKSTLIKFLAQELQQQSGKATRHPKLEVGYFAQHQVEYLHLDQSPYQHLYAIAKDTPERTLRTFLGSFGFSGDMALSPITHFSGGEKARLALALVVWTKPNLLLLDEPTNHFDMEMREALTLALQDYDGAILVVSHDRHLLRTTVDEYYLVAEGKCELFQGDLDDYQQWFKEYEQRIAQPKQKTPSVNLYNARKQLRTLEQKIDRTHKELEKVKVQLGDNELYQAENKAKLQPLLDKQKQLSADLASFEEQWLELQSQIEG